MIPVRGSTLQNSMVISKPQPSVLHPFGETSSLEVLMSLKLKTFCYITSTYLSQHFIPMHLNNHNVNSVQVHESNETYFRIFFIPTWPIKSTQELAMYIATLMTIDVHSTKPPCGILSSILWFFPQCCKGHASFCGCSQARSSFP